jgi:hypothetical protein
MKYRILAAFLSAAAILATAEDKLSTSPEETFRRFMVSMLKNDADGVKATILPTEEAAILWKGEPPSKETQTQIEKSFEDLALIRIREGETVRLPGGKTYTLEKGSTNESKIFVWVEFNKKRMPTPFWMVKTLDGWRVDAGPLIASRKAAARFRAQQESK